MSNTTAGRNRFWWRLTQGWLWLRAFQSMPHRIEWLRRRGVKIGRDCAILTRQFSTEPFLVELGDHVAVSDGTAFLTHDASVWLLRSQRPAIQHFGRIVVGSNTYIGQNCILLPGTRIGSDCIIGAGSVVRGTVPDNSLVTGNPGKVVGRASLLLEMMANDEGTFDSLQMDFAERERLLKTQFKISGSTGTGRLNQ